ENTTGGQPLMYAGSADWMPRNFYRRIEAVFPVEEPELRQRLLKILEAHLEDNKHAHLLRANGSYQKSATKRSAQPFSAQEEFMKAANQQISAQENELLEDSG
ncbi:MAG: RNA degradosome polyphosphate kinase, partial [Opitutales bacterium]